MSTNNLFDLPEINTDDHSTNFFDKIDEVEINYSSLGANVVSTIRWLCRSFNKYKEYTEALQKLQRTIATEAKNTNNDAFGVPTVNASYEDLVSSYKRKLIHLFSASFKISTIDMAQELEEKGFDLGNDEAIFDLFMKHTNNGDTSAIERTERVAAIGKQFFRRADCSPIIKKDKISFPSFYYTEKCSIWKEYVMGYSEGHKKTQAWIEAIKYFAKEQGVGWRVSGYELFEFFERNRRESQGVFEKRESEDSECITSLKLFKNGKIEMTFSTPQLAQAFFDEWIIPAQVGE